MSCSETFGFHRNGKKDNKAYPGYVFCLRSYLKEIKRKETIAAVIIATYRLSLPSIIAEYPMLFDANDPIHLLILHGEKGVNKNLVLVEARDEILFSKKNQSLEIWEVLPQYPTTDVKRTTFARGVHHPKYMLVFTDKGLHVVISTANFNGSECTDGTWHSFFPFATEVSIDEGNDFGYVLQDFLEKQSEQLNRSEVMNGLVPGMSYRCVIDWIETNAHIRSIRDQFDFSSAANVRLVSTVPSKVPLPPLSPNELQFLKHQTGFDEDKQRVYPCDACNREKSMLESDNVTMHYGSHRVKALIQHNEYLNRCRLGKLLIQQTSIGQSINNSFMDMFLQTLMPESTWDENSPSICGRREDAYHIIWPTLIHMHEIHRYFLLHPPPLHRLPSSKTATQSLPLQQTPDTLRRTQDSDFQEEDSDEEDAVKEERERRKGILFFQPSFYATMEPDIHSQFHTYEAWEQQQGLFAPCRYLVPHIKTYCRLLEQCPGTPSPAFLSEVCGSLPRRTSITGTGRRVFTGLPASTTPSNIQLPEAVSPEEKIVQDQCSCPRLGWLLLTSACLSRGAQGRIVPYTLCQDCGHVKRGYYEYRNFELGILFMSSATKQYVSLSPNCLRHRHLCEPHAAAISQQTNTMQTTVFTDPTPQLIPLPLPYQVAGSRPYCNTRQELLVCPYFHQPLEIRKYIAEFRSRDPLFCSYPSSPNTKFQRRLLSLQQQLPLSGNRHRYKRHWNQMISVDDDGDSGGQNTLVAKDGIASLLSRSHTTMNAGANSSEVFVPKRRKFVVQPTIETINTRSISDTVITAANNFNMGPYLSSNTFHSHTFQRSASDTAMLQVDPLPITTLQDQTVENSDSKHTTVRDSSDIAVLSQPQQKKIKVSQQRASFPPDKFSSSQHQRWTMSQHEQILHHFPSRYVDNAVKEGFEETPFFGIGSPPDQLHRIEHQSALMASSKSSHLCISKDNDVDHNAGSFCLQSYIEEDGNIRYEVKHLGIPICSQSKDSSVPKELLPPISVIPMPTMIEQQEVPTSASFLLQQETDVHGNIVYKVVKK